MAVSPLALVSAGAKLGLDVTVGPFTVIHDNVVVGDRVTIDSHCEIGYPTPLAEGEPLVIGDDSLIRSHSVFYEGSRVGPGLKTGHRVVVREKFVAGPGLQIGTGSDLQGDAVVGDFVRFHSNVTVGRLSRIGSYVWLYPFVILTNDPTPPSDEYQVGVVVEDFAVVATMTTVMPGIRIGARSLVGAMSLVNEDVEPDSVVAGVPARKRAMTRHILLRDGSGRSAYPWMRRFHRGYPDEVIAAWRKEFGDIEG